MSEEVQDRIEKMIKKSEAILNAGKEKLRNCPFCGREPVYVADGKVICVCGAMMRSFNDWNPFTNQEAVDRWNRRYKEQDDDR